MLIKYIDIDWSTDWKNALFRDKALLISTAYISLVTLFLIFISTL